RKARDEHSEAADHRSKGRQFKSLQSETPENPKQRTISKRANLCNAVQAICEWLHSVLGMTINSPRQAAEVDDAVLGRPPLEVVDVRVDRRETNAPLRLLGMDFAVERLPAAPHVERRVVRFAKQQRECGGAFVLQGLDRRVERDAGVSSPPRVFMGHHATD